MLATGFLSRSQTNNFPTTGNVTVNTGHVVQTGTSNNLQTQGAVKLKNYLLFDSDGDFTGDGTGSTYYSIQDHSSGNYLRMGYGFSDHLVINSSGYTGVGLNNPYTRFHIRNGASGVSSAHTNGLTIENNSDVGINLLSPNSNMGRIYFGDPQSFTTGSIEYVHNGDFFKFRTNNSEKFRITSDGKIGVGTVSPQYSMDVHGNVRAKQHLITGGDLSNGRVYIRDIGGNQKILLQSDGVSYFNSGNVGIGTSTPQSKLAVNGQIRATEVKVLAEISVPDYVFETDYKLRTLQETKEYITENKHLPEIPSAAEIGENGIDLGDMNMKLLKKIEELTLYLIEQNKEIMEMRKEINALKD